MPRPAARINRSARFAPDAWTTEAADPLASLRALIAESRIDLPPELPPMAAGLFGYLGYDMVRLVERLPETSTPTRSACPTRSCCARPSCS
jgi:anthranilate synthase component I